MNIHDGFEWIIMRYFDVYECGIFMYEERLLMQFDV